MITSLMRPLTQYRFLISQLVSREIKARYKQSFVGYFWILLNPLAQLLVYTFVVSIVFKFSIPGVPYPLFLMAALLPWIFLQSSLNASAMCLVDSSALIRKVSFPREIIPYAVVLAKLIDLFIALTIFFALFIFFRVIPAVTIWAVLPLLLIQVVLTTGLSLFLSAANLYYRDFQYLTTLLLMVWFYLTPIMYSVTLVPKRFLPFYNLNPLVGIFEGYRSALFGTAMDWTLVGWSACISTLIFMASWIWFKKVEGKFADIV